MTKMQITLPILAALNTINQAGHGAAIMTDQRGGNNHTTTFIEICGRKAGEQAYTKRLTVKHTSSYSGQFCEWEGVSSEFGELCYMQFALVDALVKRATEIINE
jgi:hypothetical protein